MTSNLPVHVVVLAAGQGSRLGQRGERPKWLLEVAGRTLAERQLEGIDRAGDAVASTAVVVGHAAEEIERSLLAAGDVRIVHNPQYAEINNWWSLLLALRELPDEGPVVVINADLLVDPAAVTEFIEESARGEFDALIAIDLERELTEESMKVARGTDGTLSRIGKAEILEPAGEYVGMLMAREGALRAMRASLESLVGRDESVDEWYEGAVDRTAIDGVGWRIWPMPSSDWVEIDDEGDLRIAEALGAR